MKVSFRVASIKRGTQSRSCAPENPTQDKETNWVPAPEGPFSLYIRCYWPEQAVLDGTWMPPQVEKVK
jgi:hypothetical protein